MFTGLTVTSNTSTFSSFYKGTIISQTYSERIWFLQYTSLRHNLSLNETELNPITKFVYFKQILRTCHIYDDVIKKLMTSQGIYLHHSNPIVLKLPCEKFHASNYYQTKVKVGKNEVQKAHPE